MIIVGGANSSNTRELYNVCRDVCKSYFCSSIEDLDKIINENSFNGEIKIGITGGSSTPKIQIEKYAHLLELQISKKLVKN